MEMRILALIMGVIGLFTAHDAGYEILKWSLAVALLVAVVASQRARQLTQRLGENPENPALAGVAADARRWTIVFLVALVLIMSMSTYAMFRALFG